MNAAIDFSDGLAGDLGHLCSASGVGAVVLARKLPDDPQLVQAAHALSALPVPAGNDAPASPGDWIERLRFSPGDDYELLLAIEPGRFDACAEAAREAGTPLFRIGQFTATAGALLLQREDGREEPLPGRGYEHYR